MGHLSQVELFAFQRVAVNHLQAMNIPVSHALVTAAKKGRLSFNTFNKRRVSAGNEASGIFGQPIDKIATDQLQGRPGSGSGAATPISAGSRSGSLQPPSSPTSTDACFMDTEPNPTAVLLEALSKTDKATAPPSPKTQRLLSLKPSEPRVPPIVRKAIDYLDQTAVKTEGLFRISGSKARIHEVSHNLCVYVMYSTCVGEKAVLKVFGFTRNNFVRYYRILSFLLHSQLHCVTIALMTIHYT
jgi:hypothetical protein